MAVDIERGPSPIHSITLASRRGGHPEPRRNIFVKLVNPATCVFTVSNDRLDVINIEVPKSEALTFAHYLKEMCS